MKILIKNTEMVDHENIQKGDLLIENNEKQRK